MNYDLVKSINLRVFHRNLSCLYLSMLKTSHIRTFTTYTYTYTTYVCTYIKTDRNIFYIFSCFSKKNVNFASSYFFFPVRFTRNFTFWGILEKTCYVSGLFFVPRQSTRILFPSWENPFAHISFDKYTYEDFSVKIMTTILHPVGYFLTYYVRTLRSHS